VDITKICTKCGFEKSIDLFDRKRSGRTTFCKACRAKKWQEYYSTPEGRAKHIANIRRCEIVRQQRNYDTVVALKQNPCVDCNNLYQHWVMQFDHKPGQTKRDNVSDMIRNRVSINMILAEITKCDLVCANCHANRTYLRQRACNSVVEWRPYKAQVVGSSPSMRT
jgi:hypothetical protein